MKYKHISQRPYCCVPAGVQMILERRKLHVPPQPDIAYDLGIILPPKDRHLLPKSHTGRKPKAGWGTRIHLKRYSLQAFFKKRKYPLRETYHAANRFRSPLRFKLFLQDNLKKDNDLLVCFNYPLLYGIKGTWGHASLAENVTGEAVVLRDPNPKYKLPRKVPHRQLLAALKNHYKGGVWVIQTSSNSQFRGEVSNF